MFNDDELIEKIRQGDEQASRGANQTVFIHPY